MDKGETPLSKLAEHYLITCRTEGKTASTLRGYREKLGRFIRWCDGTRLEEFSVHLAREYIPYLQTAPKYEGDPFRRSNGECMSAVNLRRALLGVRRAPPSTLARKLYRRAVLGQRRATYS